MEFEGLSSSPCLGTCQQVNLFYLSGPQFPHLENGDGKSIDTYLLRLVTMNERVQVKGWPNA